MPATKDQVNSYLQHYGVKGQQWGVRKDRTTGKLYPKQKRYAALAKARLVDPIGNARDQYSDNRLKDIHKMGLLGSSAVETRMNSGFSETVARRITMGQDILKQSAVVTAILIVPSLPVALGIAVGDAVVRKHRETKFIDNNLNAEAQISNANSEEKAQATNKD